MHWRTSRCTTTAAASRFSVFHVSPAAAAGELFHSLAQTTRMNDPIKTLEDILKRNGHDLDLRDRNKEENRYFLFDRISAPNDLDLAWSQFPAHREIRARACEIDA